MGRNAMIHLLTTATSNAPEVAATITVVSAAFVLILIAGIIKCRRISLRPTTHMTCVLSLTLVLTAWLISVIAVWFASIRTPASLLVRILTPILGLSVLVCYVAALIAGIVGLIDIRRHRGRYTQGRKQAWSAIAITSLVLTLTGLSLVKTLKRANDAGTADTPSLLEHQPAPLVTNADGQWLRFDDLNFRFRVPNRPWAQLDPAKINTPALVFFSRNHPEVGFQILAEQVGVETGMTLPMLTEIVRANIAGATQHASVVGQQTGSLDGVPFTDLRIDADAQPHRLAFQIRLIAHNGYAYQLQTFTAQRDKQALDHAAQEMFQRFAIIDPDRQFSSTAAQPAKSVHHPDWGYEVDAAGSAWLDWDTVATDVPGAHYGAKHGVGTVFAIIPVRLAGPPPAKPWFINAMLTYLDETYPGPAITDVRPITRGTTSGYRVMMYRSVDGTSYRYRLDLLKNDRFAYLIAGWTAGGRHTSLAAVDAMFDRVRILPPPQSQTETHPSDAQLKTWKTVHHKLALDAYDGRRLDAAAAYLRRSLELDPRDDQELLNLLNVLVELEQYDQALARTREYLPIHGANHDVLAMYAWLLHKTGENQYASDTYARIFSEGYFDEDYGQDYVILLWEMDQRDQAADQLDRFLIQHPTANLIRLRAQMHTSNEEYEPAIALLERHLNDGPFDSQTAYDLAETYHTAGKHDRGLELCNRLISEGYETWQVLKLKGQCEIELSQFDHARASFDQAAQLNPDDEQIKQYADFLSAMLDDGSDTPTPEQPTAAQPPGPSTARRQTAAKGPPPAPR